MGSFKVHQINPAVQRGYIYEYIHTLITIKHNDDVTKDEWQ